MHVTNVNNSSMQIYIKNIAIFFAHVIFNQSLRFLFNDSVSLLTYTTQKFRVGIRFFLNIFLKSLMLTKAVFICSYTVQMTYCTSELDKGFPNWGEETAANN